MAYPLGTAKTQFCSTTGAPLAAGSVYHYVPGTTTPATTYQDINGTKANSNPVILDAAGRASIFGTGSYRQVVYDASNNLIYDQVTQVPSVSNLGALSNAGDTSTGRMTFPELTLNGSTGTTITPIGNPSLLAVSNVSGTTASATQSEILFSINYISNTGQGTTVSNSANKVALYTAIEATGASGNVWAFNPLLQIASGACALGGAQVAEFDLANNSGTDFGDTAGVAGMSQPAVFGIQVTGISTNKATAAIAVLGNLADLTSPMWNRGIAFANNSVSQVTIADYTSSATSIDIRGTHSGYGIDFFNGTCASGVIRIGNQNKIVARNAANNADYTILTTTAGDNVSLGSSSNSYVLSAANLGIAPSADNTQTCGQTAARWSAVWAVNGTIQTSDPTLKTDIKPVDPAQAVKLVQTLQPIRFKWKDGGGGKPGKRQHWGWNAENVRTVFAAAGEDFGGFVQAEDGSKHLRPDQLVPVLCAALQDALRRIEVLEARK